MNPASSNLGLRRDRDRIVPCRSGGAAPRSCGPDHARRDRCVRSRRAVQSGRIPRVALALVSVRRRDDGENRIAIGSPVFTRGVVTPTTSSTATTAPSWPSDDSTSWLRLLLGCVRRPGLRHRAREPRHGRNGRARYPVRVPARSRARDAQRPELHSVRRPRGAARLHVSRGGCRRSMADRAARRA